MRVMGTYIDNIKGFYSEQLMLDMEGELEEAAEEEAEEEDGGGRVTEETKRKTHGMGNQKIVQVANSTN